MYRCAQSHIWFAVRVSYNGLFTSPLSPSNEEDQEIFMALNIVRIEEETYKGSTW